MARDVYIALYEIISEEQSPYGLNVLQTTLTSPTTSAVQSETTSGALVFSADSGSQNDVTAKIPEDWVQVKSKRHYKRSRLSLTKTSHNDRNERKLETEAEVKGSTVERGTNNSDIEEKQWGESKNTSQSKKRNTVHKKRFLDEEEVPANAEESNSDLDLPSEDQQSRHSDDSVEQGIDWCDFRNASKRERMHMAAKLTTGEEPDRKNVCMKSECQVHDASASDCSAEVSFTKERKRSRKARFAVACYSKREAAFKFSEEIWKRCYVDGKLNRRLWQIYLRKHFQKLNKYCIFTFKSSSIIKKSGCGGEYVLAYGYCTHSGCKKFKFQVPLTEKPPTITLWSAGEENHTGDAKTAQLRGFERQIAKKKLLNVLPDKFQDENVRKLDVDVFLDGNLQDIKSDGVIANARCEALSADDLAKDDIFDCQLLQRAELKTDIKERIIQECGQPLKVCLYSILQVETVLACLKNVNQRCLYFDATGSMVRKIYYDPQVVYVYVGSMNIDGTILPVISLISNRHDEGVIGSFFLNFKAFIVHKLKRKWPIFGRMVTDCSFAIINAAMHGLNAMTLLDYLVTCYKYLNGGFINRDLGDLIILHLCRNHFVKMIKTNLARKSVSGKRKTFIMEAMASLMICRSFKDFQNKFESFVRVLLSEKDSLTLLHDIHVLSAPNEDFEDECTNLGDEIDEHDFFKGPIHSTSPFYEKCMSIYTNVKTQLLEQCSEEDEDRDESSEDTRNPHYCPKFVTDVFLEHLASVVPLWTEVMVPCRGEKYADFVPSNSNAEQNFRRDKRITLSATRNLKLGRYVAAEKEYIMTKCKKLILGIKTSNRTRNKLVAYVESIADNTTIANSTTFTTKKEKDVTKRSVSFQLSTNVTTANEDTNLSLVQPISTSTPRKDKVCTSISKKYRQGIDIGAKETWKRKTKKYKYLEKKYLKQEYMKGIMKLEDERSGEINAEKTKRNEDEDIEEVPVPDCNYEISNLSNSYYDSYLRHGDVLISEKYSLLHKLGGEDARNIVLSKLQSLDKIIFIYGDYDSPLYIDDFMRLLTATSISSPLMDACIYLLSRRAACDSMYCFTVTECLKIFEKDVEEECIDIGRLYKKTTWLIPLIERNHWSLIVLSMDTMSFTLYDSGDATTATILLKKFIPFWEHAKTALLVRDVALTPRNGACTKQDDEFNCGVHVLHYVRCILTGKNPQAQFNPAHFRLQLADMCLEFQKQKKKAQPEESCKFGDLLPNGLIFSVRYYANPTFHFIVGKFDNVELESRSFRDLVKGEWLSTLVIDCAINCVMTPRLRETYLNVRCEHSNIALERKRVLRTFVLCNIMISDKILLMPYNDTGNHWCLIIADCKLKEFTHLDPKQVLGYSHHLSEFLSFLEMRNSFSSDTVDTLGWRVVEDRNLPIQPPEDSSSCGPLVIFYALQTLGFPRPVTFSPKKYRNTIARLLLQNCSQMTHICVYCGKDEYPNKKYKKYREMVRCEGCFRWVHFKNCLDYLNMSWTQIKSSDFHFTCTVCQCNSQK